MSEHALSHGHGQRLDLDTKVGQITERSLSLTVSVRGGQTILGVFNKTGLRGFEVAFSPKASGQLRELLDKAEKRAKGAGVLTHGT